MKKIFKFMLLPALVLPLLFTSCDEDRDSNPSLDLSHLAEGFVLNTPALAENNTYDPYYAKKLGIDMLSAKLWWSTLPCEVLCTGFYRPCIRQRPYSHS